MHIPKCFGTSLTDGLASAVQPPRALTGFDRVLFGAFDAFDSFDDITRAAVYAAPEALPDADLIAGHFALSTLQARYGHAQLMTVLREPVSRLLSHWLFWRGHDDGRLAGWGAWGEVVRLSRLPLGVFLSDARVACQTDNQAIRMLLWPHALIPEGGFIAHEHNAALIGEALDRLSVFNFVDVAESPELPDRLQGWLGRPFVLRRRNETPAVPAHSRRPLDRELSDAALERLHECCRLDQQLWRAVAMRHRTADGAARLARDAQLVNIARFAGLMAA